MARKCAGGEKCAGTKKSKKERIYQNRKVCERRGLTFLIWGGRTAGLIKSLGSNLFSNSDGKFIWNELTL